MMGVWGNKSTTAAVTVKSSPGVFFGVSICGGADAATCTVYNNTSAAGEVLAKLGVGAGLSGSVILPGGVRADKGIHVALTGTTPQINVYFG